jgi:hypothetical protein
MFLLPILDLFTGASGLITNVDKCSIMPIRCSDEDIAAVQQVFLCQLSEFPCHYLGAPLLVSYLGRTVQQPLVDAVAARIPTWKAGYHCPIVLAPQDRVPRKASFKFENHWLHLSSFKEIVQNAWAKQHNGSAHNVLKIKLNETARALKAWSKTLFRNARLQLQIANEVIRWLDVAQESRLLSNDELTLRKDLKLRALGLAALDRARRKQAFRINWIKSGDACIRFFHLKMSAIRRKYIYSMKRQDGTLTWAHQEKEEIIHDFFSKLMGTKEARSRTFY